MLVIRRAQFEALAQASWAAFHDLALAHCQMANPDACASYGAAELRRLVEQGLDQARQHGFEQAPDLLGYLHLALEWGADFARQPWASGILSDQALFPASRLELLKHAALSLSADPEIASPAAEPVVVLPATREAEAAPDPPPVSLHATDAATAPPPPPAPFRSDPHYCW